MSNNYVKKLTSTFTKKKAFFYLQTSNSLELYRLRHSLICFLASHDGFATLRQAIARQHYAKWQVCMIAPRPRSGNYAGRPLSNSPEMGRATGRDFRFNPQSPLGGPRRLLAADSEHGTLIRYRQIRRKNPLLRWQAYCWGALSEMKLVLPQSASPDFVFPSSFSSTVFHLFCFSYLSRLLPAQGVILQTPRSS